MTARRWLMAVLVVVVGSGVAVAGEEKAMDSGAMAGQFVDQLAAGSFEAATARFDETMKKAMPPRKLEAVWKSVQGQVGPYRSRRGTRVEKGDDGMDLVFVTCEFKAAALDVKVVIREGRISGLWFVPAKAPATTEQKAALPSYAHPGTYRDQAVTVGQGRWSLPGTFTIPSGKGPFPAVVLVHGSGPHDQDETIGPNHPFRDLAYGLASQGVAVLRYEKRTHAHGAEFAAQKEITVREETIDDALAAVALLRQRKEVDQQRIYVVGHSLGGYLAPRIGAADRTIAGLVILAGPTRSLPQVVIDQVDYLGRQKGGVSPEDQAQLTRFRADARRIESGDFATEEALMGAPASYWKDLHDYHPEALAKTLPHRMLILQGDRDYQVTTVDFKGWEQAVGSRPDVTLKLYPKLNHLFMAGEGPSVPQEYENPGHVAKAVVQDIAWWVKDAPHHG